MNKVIWISGVTVSTRAKALVLTVTPLMHINLIQHDVSIKILEIPLLLLFLGEVDTYRGSDSAAIRINFYKGPPL